MGKYLTNLIFFDTETDRDSKKILDTGAVKVASYPKNAWQKDYR